MEWYIVQAYSGFENKVAESIKDVMSKQLLKEKLGEILNKYCPKASFIPEIWQGHKNNGEGFWIALEKLQN